MNRIDYKFVQLRQEKRSALIAYITAGYPNLKVTENLVPALEKAGVDIIELGIPFSDPMADGTTIQLASQKALDAGTTLEGIFASVKRIRQQSKLPIAFMTYYNPIFHYGDEKFIKKCVELGVDGLIIPDLPPEEAGHLRKAAAKANISMVFFIAPTTTDERIKANAKASTGFIYYVALTGITGTHQAMSSNVVRGIKHAKRFTDKPICAGFGISTAAQVKEIAKAANGVIVGSAIIKEIEKNINSPRLVENVAKFVASLK